MLKGNHVVYGLLERYPLIFSPNQIEIISHRQRLLKGIVKNTILNIIIFFPLYFFEDLIIHIQFHC
ncbi:hypothetical protein COJ60_13770 [Bacillus cereus]|nr:hypothetical protein COJ60_13770 [Bacillus cereus]PNS30079.1 hypothetical protein C1640_22315 [Bacillus sp. AKBS9]PWN75291.1 hypothetical protein CV741_05545 [Bacillus cereus]PWN81017.1 hypothetical protein CV717_11840 [Bacillus cereus]